MELARKLFILVCLTLLVYLVGSVVSKPISNFVGMPLAEVHLGTLIWIQALFSLLIMVAMPRR